VENSSTPLPAQHFKGAPVQPREPLAISRTLGALVPACEPGLPPVQRQGWIRKSWAKLAEWLESFQILCTVFICQRGPFLLRILGLQ